jgi:hypothetical protein
VPQYLGLVVWIESGLLQPDHTLSTFAQIRSGWTSGISRFKARGIGIHSWEDILQALKE